MELCSLLEKKKPIILKNWVAAILGTYPDDVGAFFKDEMDMFANPVGHTIMTNAENILEGLISGEDAHTQSVYIERIIRIRAVQNFTTVQAVSFINSLKTAIIDQLESEISRRNLRDEWDELQVTVDSLAPLALGIYAKTQERIEHIRRKEIENNEKFLMRLMGSRNP